MTDRVVIFTVTLYASIRICVVVETVTERCRLALGSTVTILVQMVVHVPCSLGPAPRVRIVSVGASLKLVDRVLRAVGSQSPFKSQVGRQEICEGHFSTLLSIRTNRRGALFSAPCHICP
jgi:hypothetical protein